MREPRKQAATPNSTDLRDQGAQRADARRNLDTLLNAAKQVFAEKGVDAPVRDIATRAGVGVGTFYRHFPERADLIKAVFQQEVDACADAAEALSADHQPEEALVLWIDRYLGFIATKRGLTATRHAGNPAFSALPAYFESRLTPALEALLASAAAAGKIRADIQAWDLLRAIALLSAPDNHGKPDTSKLLVSVLLDGLRHGAKA